MVNTGQLYGRLAPAFGSKVSEIALATNMSYDHEWQELPW